MAHQLRSLLLWIEGTSTPALRADEVLTHRLRGARFANWITPGVVILSNQRVIFLPTRVGLFRLLFSRGVSIELSQVADVYDNPDRSWPPFMSLRPWGIKTTDGREFLFGAGEREAIVTELRELVAIRQRA
jgi:hypothetical protein